MSQPMDRSSRLPALGPIDSAAGEFWVENPFLMPRRGDNLSAFERNCLFLNTTGTRQLQFLDTSFASMADLDADSRSAIAADVDHDGDLDLLVGSVGGGPIRLLENHIPQGHRVVLSLVGRDSNRSGIGCRVTIRCGEHRLVRDLFPANGFMGTGPTDLTIGLGEATLITSLTIRWPTGQSEVFTNLATDCHYTLTETTQAVQTAPLDLPIEIDNRKTPGPHHQTD